MAESADRYGAGVDPAGWRPIETAPRDGTRIMVANGFGCWMAQYCDVYPSGYRPPEPWESVMLNHRHMQPYCSLVPTHWMPLPHPPTLPTPGGSDETL